MDVLAVKANEVIFRNNPHVRNVYLSGTVPSGSKDDRFHHGVEPDTLEILRCNEYDLLIDTALWNTGLYMPKLIRDVGPHAVLGFNKPAWLRQYDFNLNFSFEEKHVKNIYVSILEFLNHNVERDLHYEIFYPDSIDEDIKKLAFFFHRKRKFVDKHICKP